MCSIEEGVGAIDNGEADTRKLVVEKLSAQVSDLHDKLEANTKLVMRIKKALKKQSKVSLALPLAED